MDLSEGSALGVFTCELCELSSPYSFYGQKPPNTRAIVLLEECYGTKDPFCPEREKFLVLGSKCCLCSKTVCVGTECSLFYTKRFCVPCVRDHLHQFPEQVQNEVQRKKSVQKASCSVTNRGQ
ncbi:cysteine-rich DPF motif domain-containing protein 1 isoform X2 [Pimephales promelas]|uniref:cysteine-rich DPF motif domain-containing protein 1 isoform X2 n=1 Tax=Pimephales promelas TaxID=90988 RepID=UPI0019556E80|nr:cysteine-rich DPF motif domain-containing protein 1 isoform X2 [Pimephales promelas]KAG1953316.1 cysteine-rich DPF motif domain-containing protein [Pimephales promelas]